ncbi:MAG: hypothetical protein KKE64_07265 [Candidatus Omnitrophica bacterium]|nr:hypothetical protein [Candidatus Omnitrophota bacterium]
MKEEIESTLVQYHLDKGRGHYIAMERRIVELREKADKKEKWIDRLIGFVLGLLSGLIIAYYTYKLNNSG